MNNIDKQYLELVNHILRFGNTKQDRTGTGTKSIFGWQIRHSMKDGFPLLTTKKMAWKTMVTELLWFLRGSTNIKYLVDNGCHIWDGDCFANYVRNFTKYVDSLPENSETEFIINKDKFINKIKTDDEFAKKWGELGPVYGKQWRRWSKLELTKIGKEFSEIWDGRTHTNLDFPIDQIANLINDLKTNPDSRRLMVSAWNVAEIDQMVLPPCHYSFQFYTRELSHKERYDEHHRRFEDRCTPDCYSKEDFDKEGIPTRAISLSWQQRSVDVGLGLPFNIASYALLLEIIAKEVNMVPEEVIGNLGDCHIYLNHEEGLKEQLTRTPYELPEVRLRNYDTLEELLNTNDSMNMIQLWRYNSHPVIKLPLSN